MWLSNFCTKILPLVTYAVEKGLQTGSFGSQLKADEYDENGSVFVFMPNNICVI
jgi:hypothetical protein